MFDGAYALPFVCPFKARMFFKVCLYVAERKTRLLSHAHSFTHIIRIRNIDYTCTPEDCPYSYLTYVHQTLALL